MISYFLSVRESLFILNTIMKVTIVDTAGLGYLASTVEAQQRLSGENISDQ